MVNTIYKRKLSHNEKVFLSFKELFPPLAIQMLIEYTGDLNLKELKKAVKASSEANKGSRLILRGNDWIDSEITPKVRVIENSLFDGFNFEDESCFTDDLSYTKGPTTEVVVLSGKKNYLVFRSFHGVMDAKGVLLWVEDIFRALRNERLIGTNSNINNLELLKSFNKKDNLKKSPFFSKYQPVTGEIIEDKEGFIWYRKQLKGNYPLLVAQIAFFMTQEYYKHFDENTYFMIPVDLRNHRKDISSTANLSNPIYIEVSKKDTVSTIYQDIVQQIRDENEKKLGNVEYYNQFVPTSVFTKTLRHFSNQWVAKNRYLVSGIISNIGKVPLSIFSNNEITAKAIAFLPINTGMPFTLIITENDTFADIVISMPKRLGNNNRLKNLMNNLEKYLKPEEITHNEKMEEFLKKFNDTTVSYPKEKNLVQIFEETVRKNPEQIALSKREKTLTYKELNEKVNSLANSLKEKNIAENQVIGLLVEHTFESIIAILAILKLGATYLPIDPDYPQERIEFILKDTKVDLVLTNLENALTSALESSINLVNLNKEELYKNDTKNLNIAINPNSLAYILYTSGTSGKPKGTKITHNNVVNYISWAIKNYTLEEKTIFALFTSLSFDLTVTSIFTPLLSGNQIEVYKKGTIQIVINDKIANVIKLTPTHLKIVNEMKFSNSTVKKLIVGGESLTTAITKNIYDKFNKEVEIINEYGPTETTVGCMIHKFNPKIDTGKVVPIGVPADNVQIYLLNNEFQPVDYKETGEIYISGEGVSDGYLNRDDLTETKFIDNPFITGKKMYKTGDLGIFNKELKIEYLGRIDEQIKLRGYRIELAEIENAMAEYPSVSSCVVVLKERKGVENLSYLSAYYVADKEISTSDFNDFLAKKIPPYMLPSNFIKLETLPLTTNGKIDKASLPDFELDNVNQEAYDDLTTKIISIVAEITSVKANNINPEKSLFELGFDSLSFAILISRIAEKIFFNHKEQLLANNLERIVDIPTVANLVSIVKEIREMN